MFAWKTISHEDRGWCWAALTDQFREAVNCHINTTMTQMVFV